MSEFLPSNVFEIPLKSVYVFNWCLDVDVHQSGKELWNAWSNMNHIRFYRTL